MEDLVIKPIGVVRSRYRHLYDAPRQAFHGDSDDKQSEIQLFPGFNFEQALQDVGNIEHLWVLFWFHNVAHWKPKILPPRGRTKRGVFATRSPHRPNPIGMSVVKNCGVRRRSIIIGDCDMLNGTPVLDIKPYIPLYDSYPGSVPGWIAEPKAAYSLIIPDDIQAKLRFLTEHKVLLYDQIVNVLVFDPLPHPYRRIQQVGDSEQSLFNFAYRAWRVLYFLNNKTKELTLHSVNSSYLTVLQGSEKKMDEEFPVHCEFIKTFGVQGTKI